MKRGIIVAALLFVSGPLFSQEPKADELTAKIRHFQKEMTGIRGLDYKNDVKASSLTRAQFLEFLKTDDDMPTPEKAAILEKVYVHFGLIPPELRLLKTQIAMLSTDVAGFYHPRSKELRLIKDAQVKGSDEQLEKALGIRINFDEITFVHELCHAAQDQNCELLTLPLEEDHDDDLSLAVLSLVEGDASIVGMKFGFKENFETLSKLFLEEYKSGSVSGKDAEVPALLRRNLTFPYGYGSEFVLKILDRNKGDWKAVTAAFADLPSSSEQIMHPRKYLSSPRDNPKTVSLDVAKLPAGTKEIANNVFGEFGILILLDEYKQGTSMERRAAADGWGGDRYYLYEAASGNISSIWLSTWDTEEDADEFFKAYSAVLAAKFESCPREPAAQKLTIDNGGKHKTVLERRGPDVLALDNVDDATVGEHNAIWTSAKKVERTKVDRVTPKPPKKK